MITLSARRPLSRILSTNCSSTWFMTCRRDAGLPWMAIISGAVVPRKMEYGVMIASKFPHGYHLRDVGE